MTSEPVNEYTGLAAELFLQRYDDAVSHALGIEDVVNQLQQVLHNLSDLSLQRAGRPFEGITMEEIPLFYRDDTPTYWRVMIIPATATFVEQSAVLQADPVDVDG